MISMVFFSLLAFELYMIFRIYKQGKYKVPAKGEEQKNRAGAYADEEQAPNNQN